MSNEREARFCELYDTTSARIVAYVMRRTNSRRRVGGSGGGRLGRVDGCHL
ncbi:MAG: hypothetical protein ACRD0B_09375 [Acidimicrobiales bacterium]